MEVPIYIIKSEIVEIMPINELMNKYNFLVCEAFFFFYYQWYLLTTNFFIQTNLKFWFKSSL